MEKPTGFWSGQECWGLRKRQTLTCDILPLTFLVLAFQWTKEGGRRCRGKRESEGIGREGEREGSKECVCGNGRKTTQSWRVRCDVTMCVPCLGSLFQRSSIFYLFLKNRNFFLFLGAVFFKKFKYLFLLIFEIKSVLFVDILMMWATCGFGYIIQHPFKATCLILCPQDGVMQGAARLSCSQVF